MEGRDYRDVLVPIPPDAEQRRIVSKVDELIGLCGILETALTKGQAGLSRLLDSALHKALDAARPD